MKVKNGRNDNQTNTNLKVAFLVGLYYNLRWYYSRYDEYQPDGYAGPEQDKGYVDYKRDSYGYDRDDERDYARRRDDNYSDRGDDAADDDYDYKKDYKEYSKGNDRDYDRDDDFDRSYDDRDQDYDYDPKDR